MQDASPSPWTSHVSCEWEVNGLTEVSLARRLSELAAASPETVAVTNERGRLTRGELETDSNNWAHEFIRSGIKKGEFVAFSLSDDCVFFSVLVAVWKVGGVPLPLSDKLSDTELTGMLDAVAPRIVIGRELKAVEGRTYVPADFQPVSAEVLELDPTVVSPSWKAIGSGGSTGRPKVIVTPTAGLLKNQKFKDGPMGIRKNETTVVTAPLTHNGPFIAAVHTLLQGGRVVLTGRFNPERVLAAVERESATWLYMVPTMMSRIWKLPAETRECYDLSSLNRVVHMGAPCPEWLKRAWIDWLGPEKIIEMYTSTEALAMFSVSGTEWLDHPGTVGRLVRGQLEIRSGEGEPLPLGETGLVWVKDESSGGASYRYLGAQEKADAEGWQTLGDIGRVDKDGYLYIADRETDMILVGGSNVYPAELEGALSDHPAVVDVAVIGLPHEDLGQAPHVIVHVAKPVTEEELQHHLLQKISAYKRPRSWEFAEEPIRDAAGKTNRRRLREARLGRQPPVA